MGTEPSLSTHLPLAPVDKIPLMGVLVSDVGRERAIDNMLEAMRCRKRCLVLYVNAQFLNSAVDIPWFRAFANTADLALCDSVGAQLAAMVLHGRAPKRNTPPDWIESLGRRAGHDGRSVFWLGGRADVVATAAENFRRATGTEIAGFQHGYIDLRPGATDNQSVIRTINDVKPDMLFVNLGIPLQETWLRHALPLIDVPLVITGGALVDHVAGRARRPPQWITAIGIEWIYRLAKEPRRLWRRYILGLPVFGFRLLVQSCVRVRRSEIL
jgi:N-acetylglucosaminyldiphosphoundecaprenol N-acetyl-beta-D-mannosaminyltransferase